MEIQKQFIGMVGLGYWGKNILRNLHCGYNEIEEPRRKNVLINYEKLRELAGAESYDLLKRYHQGWMEKYLGNVNNIRDDKWTKGIAACPVKCLPRGM